MAGTSGGIAVIDRLFLRLASAGYDVAPHPVGPDDATQEIRPRGFRAQLRLGEVATAADGSRRLVLSADIDLRGDIATPGIRRWRIARSFAEFDGGVGWELRALVSLGGDLSDDFVATEGRNAGGLIGSLLSDGRLALASARVMPSAREPTPPGPDLIIDLVGASDLATGSCHLAWYGDRRRTQTPEHRRIRLAACDRLSDEVLPLVAALSGDGCGAAARRPVGRPQTARSGAASDLPPIETAAAPTV